MSLPIDLPPPLSIQAERALAELTRRWQSCVQSGTSLSPRDSALRTKLLVQRQAHLSARQRLLEQHGIVVLYSKAKPE